MRFALSRLKRTGGPLPIGVLREVDRPVYEDELVAQVDATVEREGPGDISQLLTSGTTWDVD